MNGGSDTGSSPSYSATGGGWNSGTGVFTPTSGNPSSSVTVGQFANVFTDGSTTPVFVGRVTAVNTTTVTVSTTAKSGTAPTTSGSGISINVGAAWKGPNGSDTNPFSLVTGVLTDSSGDLPRVNLLNSANYTPNTNLTTPSGNGHVRYEGYTATAGDGGRATIAFSTNAAGVNLASNGQASCVNIIATSSASSGTTAGFSGGSGTYCIGCVATGFRGAGFTGFPLVIECEAYANNTANTSQKGGFVGCTVCIRCWGHDNTGSNSAGFFFSGTGYLIDCIASKNQWAGVATNVTNGSILSLVSCDLYNNTGDGINAQFGGGNACLIFAESCNFVKNGGYGINNQNNAHCEGRIANCGFGSGTMANTSGNFNHQLELLTTGTVTYASGVNPWSDPDNGNFNITLAAAEGTGRGVFTQTNSGSYSNLNTVGYPDIGAAQHQASSGGSVGRGILSGGRC
jgi:hypothetical protein